MYANEQKGQWGTVSENHTVYLQYRRYKKLAMIISWKKKKY